MRVACKVAIQGARSRVIDGPVGCVHASVTQRVEVLSIDEADARRQFQAAGVGTFGRPCLHVSRERICPSGAVPWRKERWRPWAGRTNMARFGTHVHPMAVPVVHRPSNAEAAAFLERLTAVPAVRAGPSRRPRLPLAFDATASREATWDGPRT
jgi:hypothetical protein